MLHLWFAKPSVWSWSQSNQINTLRGSADSFPNDIILLILLIIQGFDDHVKNDHYMWNYVYYSMHLDSIDTTNHTAIQKYVYGLVK